MSEKKLPAVKAVDAIAVQPKQSDQEKMDFIQPATGDAAAEPMTVVVRIELDESSLLFNGRGVLFFVGDYQITKYAGYKWGIFFKVYDPSFFDKYGGEEIRLSEDGENFVSTGRQFPRGPDNASALLDDAVELPTQEEILK